MVVDRVIEAGDFVELTADRLAYGGEAVARHEGLAVFVPLAAPGERLRVRITERRKNYARGEIERIIEPSAHRRQPVCRHFGDCGGCQLQHITYDAQLAAKVGFVRDSLERIGGLDWPHEIEILHGNELGYRTRAQVRIDHKTGRVGFNRGRSNAVCDVESCPVLTPELDRGLSALRRAMAEASGEPKNAGRISQIDIAAGESGVSFEPAVRGLPGGALRQTVRDAVYSFTPSTFFQSNLGLLERLIDEAIGGASGDVAIDLYAGVGLFTVQLARRFKRVFGVEAEKQAAKHAQLNTRLNGVDNVEFSTGNVDVWLTAFIASGKTSADFLLLDPPRTGAAKAIPSIIELNPRLISYVSCDPVTLARDLRVLTGAGYTLARVTAIDLFPQTYHVEAVDLLSR